jgi:hypothetical protein
MTTTPVNIEIDGQSIIGDELVGCSFDRLEDNFCSSVTLELAGMAFYDKCDPSKRAGELRVKISIGSLALWFLIETRGAISEASGGAFEVSGRSKQALLHSPFADLVTDTDETSHPWQGADCQFSEIISHVVANYSDYGGTVTLNADDFQVKKYSFSATDQTPIEIIRTLADSAGYILTALDNGNLTIDEYSVEEGSPIDTLYDHDEISQIGEEYLPSSGFDAVTVTGKTDEGVFIQAAKLSDLEAEDEIDCMDITDFTALLNPKGSEIYAKTPFVVRVYYYHPTLTPLYSASDSAVSVAQAGGGVESRSEYVDLIWGYGNTSYPNLAGETLVEGDESVPFERRLVEYQTRYLDYNVKTNTPSDEDDPDDPGFAVMFYFSDKSAYSNYTFYAGIPIEDDWDYCKSIVVDIEDGDDDPISIDESNWSLRNNVNHFNPRGSAGRLLQGSESNAPQARVKETNKSAGASASLSQKVMVGQHPISRGRTFYLRIFPQGAVSRIATSAGSGAASFRSAGVVRIGGWKDTDPEPEDVVFVDGVAWTKYPMQFYRREYYLPDPTNPSENVKHETDYPIFKFQGTDQNFSVQYTGRSARLYCAAFRGSSEYAYMDCKVKYVANCSRYKITVPDSWDSNYIHVFLCFDDCPDPMVLRVNLAEVAERLAVEYNGTNVRAGSGGSVKFIDFVGNVSVTNKGNSRVEVNVLSGGDGGCGCGCGY